jgi:hypothetical protein
MGPRRGVRYGKLRGGHRVDRTVAAGLDQTGDTLTRLSLAPPIMGYGTYGRHASTLGDGDGQSRVTSAPIHTLVELGDP